MEKENREPNKWVTLIIVITMTFMACLDSSIINVALPVLTKELVQPLSSIEWVVISYLITICSTLIFFGRLGDVFGKSRIFKLGTGLFTLGSLLCGLSPNLGFLILSRIIQSIGASAYMANNQGIITQTFRPDERGKALGVLGSSVALGTMVGPALGGLILSAFTWHFIFFVNVPIGIVSFILGFKLLPSTKHTGENIDWSGAVMLFFGILLFFGPMAAQEALEMPVYVVIILVIIGIILLLLFIKHTTVVEQPLLQLKLFKNPLFSLSLFCGFTSFICLNASIILIPFYLEDTLKISTSTTGFLMMISPIVVAVLSPYAGRLSDKVGSELISMIGLFVLSISFFLMGFLTETSPIIIFIIFVAIMGIGQGFFQPANNSLIMSCPSPKQLGVAGSINALVRNLGLVAGVTMCTTLLYTFMSYRLGEHVTDYVDGKDYVFIYGMNKIYIILCIICLVGAFASALRFIPKKKNTI